MKDKDKTKDKTKGWTYTAGTEGTGAYQTVCSTAYGKLAFRAPGGSVPVGYVRVRVEPVHDNKVVAKMATTLSSDAGWKQPNEGDQHRFSKVVRITELKATIALAKEALGVGRIKTRQNPTANRKALALTQAQG